MKYTPFWILGLYSSLFHSLLTGSTLAASGPLVLQAGQGQTLSSSTVAGKPPLAFRLEDGTPIKLRLTRTISSADARVDDQVDFEVLEEVKVGDVVVPRGGIALGTVTEAQPKRRMGRGGKLNVYDMLLELLISPRNTLQREEVRHVAPEFTQSISSLAPQHGPLVSKPPGISIGWR